MNDLSQSLQTLQGTLADGYRAFIEYLPHFAAALLLLVIGWLVARLMRHLSIRLAGGLNNILAGIGRWSGSRRRVALTPGARALSSDRERRMGGWRKRFSLFPPSVDSTASRCILAIRSAHLERWRDRPFDTAATEP
jgi:hypothetical protein